MRIQNFNMNTDLVSTLSDYSPGIMRWESLPVEWYGGTAVYEGVRSEGMWDGQELILV